MQYRKEEIGCKSDYFYAYDNEDKIRRALDNALDIRKFEIELYWKRATYFWAFIAAAFTGYFAVVVMGKQKDSVLERSFVLSIVSSIGLIFSYGWFLANKGSKYWQENWEKHVDILEDDVVGPLYKTTINVSSSNKFSLLQPYQFSVSKINQVLSFFVVGIWYFLHINSIFNFFSCVNLTDLLLLFGNLTLNFSICLLLYFLPKMTASGESNMSNRGWFSRRVITEDVQNNDETPAKKNKKSWLLLKKICKAFIYLITFILFCWVYHRHLLDLENVKNAFFLVSIFALRESVTNLLIEGKNAHAIFVDIDTVGTKDHLKFIVTAITASLLGKIKFLKIIPASSSIVVSGKLKYNVFDDKLYEQVTRLTSGFDPFQHEQSVAAAKAAVWGKVSVSAAMLTLACGIIISIPDKYIGIFLVKCIDIYNSLPFLQ